MNLLNKAAVCTALVCLLTTHALAANLITNGTFESPSVGSTYASYAAGSTGITGWIVDTTPADGVQLLSSANETSFNLPNNGTQVLQLTGGPGNVYSAGGGIHQTITATPNQSYNISIDVASRNGSPVTGNLSFGGQNHALAASSKTFTTLTWQVTATNTNPVIDIAGSSSSASVQLMIDNVSVTTPAGPVNAETSTVVASPNSIPADGSTTATITVSLQDANGNPVSGKTVTLTSSRGNMDTISAASGPSSASGIVTFTVQSATTGTALFSATDVTDNLALASTAAVFVYDAGAKGPQASPDPIVFDQTATNDNLVALLAAGSEYSSDLTLYQDGPSNYPKHFWINNWSNGTNDYFKWNVALAAGAVYHVYAKLSASAAVPLQLSITGTNTVLNFTTRNIGWDKLDCGTITIPGGTNQLVLRKNTSDTSQVLSIKSLELIRESDLPAYQQRVANFKADTTWLSQSKYGLMTQFGAWGYPPTGPQPSLQNFANGFNVNNFVNLVTNAGCKYVIFSITWYSYQMLAPIQSVDQIVPGDTNITSTRDVIGELAAALHAAGVRFMLYYHCGSDSQSPGGYDSTPWWQAQQFPAPIFTERGVADRSVFLTNWCNVITEIGNRYGTNLDGWFIDDGMVYYPAPFEHLGQAARAGNPNRLVCYNPWIATEYTDFQDVFMGEQSQGQSQFGSTPVGGNGVFTDGPQVGLLQHGMFTMEQDWGIHESNQPITTQITASQAIGWVKSASARGVPLSFNMMLWSDQTYSTNSLNVLLNLKSAIYGGNSASLSSNNLVANGTFGTPALSSGTTNFAAGSTALTGWTVDASPSDGVQLGAEGTFGPDNGSQDLQLTGGGSGGGTYSAGGGISQTIATTPGATYTIIIDVASRQGNAVTGNFNFGGSNYALNASNSIFTTLTWKAVATSSNTIINITGSTNSSSAQLLVDNVSVTPFSDPDITTQPASQSVILGGTASFDVAVSGTAPFSYQWYFNTNTAISGANDATLILTNVQTSTSGTFNVVVTNAIGAMTSSIATLTVVPDPITIMPLGDSITAGGGEGVSSDQAGYRDQLYAMLTYQGANFTFIGSAATGLNVYSSPQLLSSGNAENNGFGSYQLGDLYTNLAGTFPGGAGQPAQGGSTNMGGYWMTGTTNANFSNNGATVSRPAAYPNVLLLLGGVNDIYFGGTNATSYLQAETNASNILSWFKTNRPGTVVFEGSVLPVTTGVITGTNPNVVANYNTQINAFNAWLATNVATYGTNYHFVNTAAGFLSNGMANANICYDGIHPTTNGYRVLGNEWDAALLSNGIISTAVTGTVIGLGNYSFENQSVAADSYTSFGTGAPEDWSSANVSGAVVAIVSPGASDGRGYGSNPVGLDGSNYCQIYAYQAGGVGMVYQDTGVKYQAGAAYTITTAFGMENGSFATGSSMGFYNSNLTPIATKTIATNNLTLGAFTNIALSYTGTGNEGGNGDIIVGFHVPSTAGAAFFDFDNVRLVATNPVAPSVTSQPIAVTTNAGGAASFSVAATGTVPLSYQWYFDTNNPVSGATNASLSLTNVQSSGTYDAVVTNSYGSVTSSIAKLTILPNAPSSLTATPGVNSITVSYAAVVNAKFYVIYRSKVSGGPYTKIATTTTTKYVDHNVIAGTTYYYVAISCDGVSLSSYSNQASADARR